MRSAKFSMKTDCPGEGDAAAWLAGELPPGESAAFARHLAGCAECRHAVAATRHVVDRLQSLPAPGLERDLAPAIIARLHAKPKIIPRNTNGWLRMTAAAIAALLLPSAFIAWFMDTGKKEPSIAAAGHDTGRPPVIPDADAAHVSRALDWFYVHQEIDGSWDPAKWGGSRRFKSALTALPLISLLKGARSPEHHAAAERAVAWLRRGQKEDGSFGRSFGDGGYNHGISTLALLYAWQARPEPDLKASATAALHFALGTRTAGGGWGDSVNPDVSVTLWYREMLDLAARLGWDEAASALSKTDQWLASQTASPVAAADAAEFEAIDYLQAYFSVTELLREGTPQASARLSSIRWQLVTSQSLTGDYPGTWEPTGSWGRAGGRIYSTALACLALR
jgi:hypothetical protein